ncbi:cold-inducible protein YdjO-related protein [Neobacillus thermocopriae]|uniref:cold-inducible protein YdjO-related protein n=1 Tax=Neobacillus thermocopriae TaxID=1215031 RepID=UPI001969C53A|nr:cold-inducible protein YdjO-related protein [Neobacillus thermocopriae]
MNNTIFGHTTIKKEAVPIFFGKRGKDEELETILVETEVFSCMDETCIGWMRKEFVSDDLLCPMCGKEMIQEIRELPKI